MIENLQYVADVLPGHPFRGSIAEIPDGNARALQMRDIGSDGQVNWNGMVQTQLESRREPDWLQAGDIVFAARGQKNYAVCLSEVPFSAVCSQYFFLLRCRGEALLPDFLAWQINSLPCQRYFASSAEGTDQLSIRRPVLEALSIAVPSLADQLRIVELERCAKAERSALENLIQNRQRQLDALALQLFTSHS